MSTTGPYIASWLLDPFLQNVNQITQLACNTSDPNCPIISHTIDRDRSALVMDAGIAQINQLSKDDVVIALMGITGGM